MLKAASEQKAYRLHLEMENKIYDVVEAQTASQIAALRGLSAQLQQTEEMDAAKKLLGKIVVIGTYIKRRSNLLFVAGQEGSIRSEELLLCVNESAESLRLYGVNCGVKISGCQRLAPEIAYMVYDILEAVIETGMGNRLVHFNLRRTPGTRSFPYHLYRLHGRFVGSLSVLSRCESRKR